MVSSWQLVRTTGWKGEWNISDFSGKQKVSHILKMPYFLLNGSVWEAVILSALQGKHRSVLWHNQWLQMPNVWYSKSTAASLKLGLLKIIETVWAGREPQSSSHSKPPPRGRTHSTRVAQKPEERQKNLLLRFLRLISLACPVVLIWASGRSRVQWKDVRLRLTPDVWRELAGQPGSAPPALKYSFQTNTKKGLFLGQDLSTQF